MQNTSRTDYLKTTLKKEETKEMLQPFLSNDKNDAANALWKALKKKVFS